MALLIAGLIVLLGMHSVRVFADPWRTRMIARMSLGRWKLLYSVVSLVGLLMVIEGFGQARESMVLLWVPPIGMRHFAGLLVLIAFILLVAAYIPRNVFKARLHHPMLIGVKLWAFAHLLANGALTHVLLFGALLLWSAIALRAAAQLDRAVGTVYAAGTTAGTVSCALAGAALWALTAFWLHGVLIGVRPFG